MDTKPLEQEAEYFVQHKLIKGGLKISKPNFDSEGADLLIVDNISAKLTKIIKVQCKGRTVDPSAEIKIHKSYVTENFIAFIYTKLSSGESDLFLFTSEEISNWRERDGFFVIGITEKKLKNEDLAEYRFKDSSISRIKDILKNVGIKRYSSLIAEKDFMEHAIDKTLSIYEEIYPGRKFPRPTTSQVVASIVFTYDKFRIPDVSTNCYIFSKSEKSNSNRNITVEKILGENNAEIKVYTEIISGDIHTEILQLLNRTINTENIMLAIDDYVYEEPLNALVDKGVDVVLVQLSSSDGRQIYTKHKWGDIVYAIGHAIGLSEYEW